MENDYRNPSSNFSIWDSVLYELARFEPNILLLLNCSVHAAGMDGDRIAWVEGWQGTAETRHRIQADLFADCSGDSILAPLSGAAFRIGREAAGEFGEDIEPPIADRRTMGMSCLLQARETDSPKSFIPPRWARQFPTDDDLPNRGHGLGSMNNFWWIELGGEYDSIHDTERLRDELLKITFGVWDHIKNHGDHGAENWELEWIGFLPGKRESRRYVGDHILTQNDVRAEGRFDDLVAYGGWSMDDHHPGGFAYAGAPTQFHPAPSPYGIPYRCLYSKNVENLLFAGRNISCTHAAMSSTRVMATCAIVGQAAGTAAAVAAAHGVTPRGVCDSHIRELQQALMEDDCWLPWHRREIAPLSTSARLRASAGDPEALRNGIDRPVDGDLNAWEGRPGDWIEYRFERPSALSRARIVFDSDLDRRGQGIGAKFPEKNCLACYPLGQPPRTAPAAMTRRFRLEIQEEPEGPWRVLAREDNNYQRLVRLPLAGRAAALRLVPEATWGAEAVRIFAFEVA